MVVNITNVFDMQNLLINEVFGSTSLFGIFASILILVYALKKGMSPLMAIFFISIFGLFFVDTYYELMIVGALFVSWILYLFVKRNFRD